MLGVVFNHTVIARFQLVTELHILDVMDNLLLLAKYCIKNNESLYFIPSL